MNQYASALEAVKTCNASHGHIPRWVSEGKTPVRVAPGGHHEFNFKYIPRFLRPLGMPIPAGLGGARNALLLGPQSPLFLTKAKSLTHSNRQFQKTGCA